MIIDTHLHYGSFGIFDLDMKVLEEQMDKYDVSIGIISTIECAEYQAYSDELIPNQKTQIEANKILLEHVNKSNGRLYASFWCKPASEQNADDVYDFIKANDKWIKGLKFHPFYSRLPLEDSKYDIYMDLARQLDIPVSIHCANDQLSNPLQVLSMAKRFPGVNIIMVHMGLYSDNELAIECLSQADNLYGDTTWVPMDKVEKAMEICGCHKMLFGSDAPIDGSKSYVFYEKMLETCKEQKADKWDRVFCKNARELFKI